MEGNARTWFTPKQKAELWERWKRDHTDYALQCRPTQRMF